MKTKLLGWVALVACVCGASPASATDQPTFYAGPISRVRVDSDGRALIIFGPVIPDGAGCRDPGLRNVVAIDTKTEAGRAMLQVALAMKLSGGQVIVYGSGHCTIYSQAENADRLESN